MSRTDITRFRRFSLRFLLIAAAWLVPGLGHVLLRRWGRGLAFFGLVGALALLGILLRGHVFYGRPADAFEWLGLASNFGAGGFYVLARLLETHGPDISRASGDYGTRFFAAAGVLNLLCVLDAADIASGRKD